MQFELMIDQDQNPAEWLIPAHISFSLVVTTRPLLYAISFTTVNYFSKVETHISRVLIWDQEVNFHLSLLSVRPIEPVSCFSFIKCRKKAKLLSKEKFILLRVETLFFFIVSLESGGNETETRQKSSLLTSLHCLDSAFTSLSSKNNNNKKDAVSKSCLLMKLLV